MGKEKFSCSECGGVFAKRQSVKNHLCWVHDQPNEEVQMPNPRDESKSPEPDLVEASPPPSHPRNPSDEEEENNQNDQSWRELVEAELLLSKLPLWGIQGRDTFNIGAQYVDGLSSSKSFKDFAVTGTTHFKEFKIQLNLAKSEVVPSAEIESMMVETNFKMKENLCKAVANLGVALAGATDPQSLIYKKEIEEEKESELVIKKTVARNLFVCLSYLVPRVVRSTRLALYVELAAVLATALSLGRGDKRWLEGVEEKWREVVEMFKYELPELVNSGQLPMSSAGEQVQKKFTAFNWYNIRYIEKFSNS